MCHGAGLGENGIDFIGGVVRPGHVDDPRIDTRSGQSGQRIQEKVRNTFGCHQRDDSMFIHDAIAPGPDPPLPLFLKGLALAGNVHANRKNVPSRPNRYARRFMAENSNLRSGEPPDRVVRSFWYGQFSPYEALCLSSFVAAGIQVELFCEGPVAGVPDGVTHRDSRDILDRDVAFYQYEFDGPSPSLHANHFRYALLEAIG